MVVSIFLQHRSIVHLKGFICVLPIFLIIFCLFQVGVVVYGYRPKIWFLLNRHGRSDTLLQEIQSTPFDESPGNNIGQCFFSPSFLIDVFPDASILTELGFIYAAALQYVCVFDVCEQWYCLSPSAGEAVTFTTQYLLSPAAGQRPRVPGAVVIIADKKSADNLTLAASRLRATGMWEQSCGKLNKLLAPIRSLHLAASVKFSFKLSAKEMYTNICNGV